MKKAVIVGINYKISNQLYGCVEDAKDMDFFLKSLGYETYILIDDDATREAIIKSFSWLLIDTKEAYFHFSGHGKNSFDGPCLLTSDKKYITHQEINEKLFSKLGMKTLRMSLDCCIQFTLPWCLIKTKNEKHPVTVTELPCDFQINKNIIIISGVGKTYDKIIDGKRNGILTYNFLKLLKENGNMKCSKLLRIMSIKMEGTGSSVSIYFGQKMGVDTRFLS